MWFPLAEDAEIFTLSIVQSASHFLMRFKFQDLLFFLGYLDQYEFDNLNQIGLEEYTEIIARENPRFKHRYSNQAWLHMEQWVDDTVYKIREK